MNKYNLRFALVITISLALVGCGGTSEDEALSAPASPTDPSTNAPEAEVEHPDTVREIMALGSRNAKSRHVPVVTEGASQWQPYDRPPTHTHAVGLPNQTIEMSDGTKLFVKVTLPGFSSETAAPGSFPVVLTQTSYNTSVGQFVPEVGGGKRIPGHARIRPRGCGCSGNGQLRR